jgi:hypothetical protein
MAKVKQEILVFKSSEIKRCIHHALCATRWTAWSNPTAKDELTYAALVVITDYSGTYIMSAGYPRQRLRNKKIYSAYAAGANNSVKDVLQNDANPGCLQMNEAPVLRNGLRAIIYLSIGENGHCYEEILAEAYDTFEVTITDPSSKEVAIEFNRPNKHINSVINNLDMNNDEIVDSKTSKRRLLADDEQTAHPKETISNSA